MITDHSYLDGPTFRGMRQSLLRTFDDLYVLDLHGNARKKETGPDGSPDQSVFDIMEGVAIAFFVKRGGSTPDGRGDNAVVHHAGRFGSRKSKYDWLHTHDRDSTEWQALNPASPHYLFVPRDEALEAAYNRFMPVTEVFPVHSVGIVTARDGLTIRWSADEVWNTVTVFSRMEPELARQGYELGNDARDWKVTLAQQDVRDSGPARERVVPILYRPFDVRHTYYTGHSRGFICMPRPEVMRHMLAGENRALHVCRQTVSETWQHGLVTNGLTDDCYVSNKTRERGYTLPLYLYPTADRGDLFARLESSARQPNLNPKLVVAPDRSAWPSTRARGCPPLHLRHPVCPKLSRHVRRVPAHRLPARSVHEGSRRVHPSRGLGRALDRPAPPRFTRTRHADLPLRGRRRCRSGPNEDAGLSLRLGRPARVHQQNSVFRSRLAGGP